MKNSYKSKYTDRLISAAQYLAEFICERIAKRDNQTLTYKFWNSDSWKNIFVRQTAEATKLLQESDIVTILAFLRSKKGQSIYSLGLKKVILEGCKNQVKYKEEHVEFYNEDGDPFIMTIEFDIPENDKKTDTNLWEKLGG